MPTKRRRRAPSRHHGISPEGVAAWRAGAYWQLHRALGLAVWQMPEWCLTPPGADNRPENLRRAYPGPDVAACKAALVEMVGPPPRRWRY